ncbi:hypothetical protein BHE74_00051514 [Ensete ventricosum]|nr:hypothetical protein BHE74_00051514 [Ensete ventricosum]
MKPLEPPSQETRRPHRRWAGSEELCRQPLWASREAPRDSSGLHSDRQNTLQSADQDGLLLGQVWGGIAHRVSRPIEPEPPNWTTNIKVAGLPTFVTGRCPANSKIDPGGKVVTAPTLAVAKARHEQVPSRNNPGSSALTQEDNKVTPRVGCYLAGRDSPPPQALLDEWVQRKPETDLQSIYRDAYVGNVQVIRALPRLRNMQPVFSRDAIPLPNHGK